MPYLQCQHSYDPNNLLTLNRRDENNTVASAFLNNYSGIMNEQSINNSAAYIQGWLKQLRNDKKFIAKASAKASGEAVLSINRQN